MPSKRSSFGGLMCVGFFAIVLCLTLCIAQISAHQLTKEEIAINESIPFPTPAQLRSINRLLGEMGLENYVWEDRLRRVVSSTDPTSVLFKDNVELQAPYRMQYVLSHQKREELINRLFFTTVVNDDEKVKEPSSFITPFILPALVQYQQFNRNTQQNEALFTNDEKALLTLLQQLQQHFVQDNLFTRYEESNKDIIKSNRHALNRAMSARFTEEAKRDEAMKNYKRHLFGLFGNTKEALSSNFMGDVNNKLYKTIVADLGTVSPLLHDNNLLKHALNQDDGVSDFINTLPILLISLPQDILNNVQNKAILQRFIIENPRIVDTTTLDTTTIDKLNLKISSLITKATTQLQINTQQRKEFIFNDINLIELSKKMFYISLTDVSGMNYVHDGANFNFWLHLLYNTPSKTTQVYTPTIHTSLLTQIQDEIHDYFKWDFYTLPLQQPKTIYKQLNDDKSTQNKQINIEIKLQKQQQSSTPITVELSYPQQFFTFSIQEELYMGYNLNVYDIVQESLLKDIINNKNNILSMIQQELQTSSGLSDISLSDVNLVLNIKDYKYQILSSKFDLYVNNENNNISNIIAKQVLQIRQLQNQQQNIRLSSEEVNIEQRLMKYVQQHDVEQQQLNDIAPENKEHYFNYLKTWLFYYDYSRVVANYITDVYPKVDVQQGLFTTANTVPITSILKHLSTQQQQQNSAFTQQSSGGDVLRDDATCTQCKAEHQAQYDEMTKTLPDWFTTNLEGVCISIWPVIAPIFGHNMCDPAVPNECYTLCMGMVNVYKDNIADTLAFLFHDPERTCYKEQKCPTNPDDLPPQVDVPTLTPRDGDRAALRTIFHITDIHWDHLYDTKEGQPRCRLPVCCHKEEQQTIVNDMNYNTFNVHLDQQQQSEEDSEFQHYTTPQQRFSLITPRHENAKPRIYGEYLCDSPELLMQTSAEQILLYCPTYVVFGGDSPAHDLWKQTQASNLDAVHTVNALLLDYSRKCTKIYKNRIAALKASSDGKTLPAAGLTAEDPEDVEFIERYNILFNQLPPHEQQALLEQDKLRDPNDIPAYYPVLGNHAAVAVNSFAGFGKYDDWLLKPVADHWATFLSPSSVKTVRQGAFYVEALAANTYVVGLHTGLLDKNNPWRILNLGYWDPSGQFSIFVAQVFEQIRKLNGKVIIVVHEPHGDCINGAAKDHLLMLFTKYKDIIINTLAGHQHHDLTQLLHNNYPVNLTQVSTGASYFDNINYIAPLAFTAINQQSVQLQQRTQQIFGAVNNVSTMMLKNNNKKPIINAYLSTTYATPYVMYYKTLLNLPLTMQHTQVQKLLSYLTVIDQAIASSTQQKTKLMKKTLPNGITTTVTINPLFQLQPLHLELLPSSITPFDYSTNPSYRLIDMKNAKFTNFRQYTYDIMLQDTVTPTAQWKQTYDYTSLYSKWNHDINAVTGQTWQGTIVQAFNKDPADQSSALFVERYLEVFWGGVPDGIDPEFQPTRWNKEQLFCTIYTHSDEECKYCLEHIND